MRLVSGQQEGLWKRWRLGNARLRPGVIHYRGVEVPVGAISRAHQRHPSGRELASLTPDFRIIEVVNGSARIEWALPNDLVAWAVEQVQPGPGKP
jgi:hypothetical protein